MDRHNGSCRDRGSQTHNKQGQMFGSFSWEHKTKSLLLLFAAVVWSFLEATMTLSTVLCIRWGMLVRFRCWRWHFWLSKISTPFCDVAGCIFQFSKGGCSNISYSTCPSRTLFATPHQEVEPNYLSLESGWASDLRVTSGTWHKCDVWSWAIKDEATSAFLKYLLLSSWVSTWAVSFPEGSMLWGSPS